MRYENYWCVGINAKELLNHMNGMEIDYASVCVPIVELQKWHEHKQIEKPIKEWLIEMDEGDMDGFLDFTDWRPMIINVEAW